MKATQSILPNNQILNISMKYVFYKIKSMSQKKLLNKNKIKGLKEMKGSNKLMTSGNLFKVYKKNNKR